MSLKAFHLVFITAAALLALFCGIWWINAFLSEEAGGLALVAGLAALGCAVGLGFYERYFLRKLKSLS